ncbi:MAG: hypothetical protein RDU25_04730 [Patescibacteria group bacterium]|nr:hypothetical protein [Patescibacteria group bacterium]
MEWLFIETTRPGEFRLGLLGPKDAKVKTYKGRSNSVLTRLSSLVKRTALTGLGGICVVSGPGSFTSVRTGVLIANILARKLKKPLVGIKLGQTKDMLSLGAKLAQGKFKKSTYVKPVYDAEPNITLPHA